MTIPFQYHRAPRLLALAGAVAMAFAAGCSNDGSSGSNSNNSAKPGEAAAKYQAEISRTSFGVPHIKANDEGSLAYGVATAYAQDNVCLMADEFTTVSGERSKHFGPTATRQTSDIPNLQTDFFYRIINDDEAVKNAWNAHSAPMKAMIEGYVAGYNDYLDKTGMNNLPTACKNGAWVRKVNEQDMIKLLRRYAAEASSGQFIAAMVGATPPGQNGLIPAVPPKAGMHPMDPDYWVAMRERTGSNAVALGKDATDNGQGMLLGTPHFPWRGALRFYQLHLTIPGKLDAMGAALGGMPMVNIGFNQNLAWTHTVNNSAHFTVHMTPLDPSDPTKYIVDGKPQAMTRKTINVEVKGADGLLSTQTRTFYSSQYGPVVVIPGQLDWNAGMAFSLNDANLGNHRLLEQWYGMNTARSLDEFKASIDRTTGLPWVNTLAVDKEGASLFMDVTVVPHVTKAMQDACVPGPFKPLAARGLFVLNGATSACAPATDKAAPQPGIFAGASLPRLVRSDYVQNSNDSAWLSNPQAPLTGFPDIVSVDNVEQFGRTRLGITQVQKRLAGTDGLAGRKMTVAQLQALALGNRVYYADQIMDDVLALCRGDQADSGDITAACARLNQWDRTVNLDSNIGYLYFTGLWERILRVPGMWAVPFNPADPVNTPHGLNRDNPAIATTVRQALAAAAQDVAKMGVSQDARWGDVQLATRGTRRIPIHGGKGTDGVYNAIGTVPSGDGKLEVIYGTSYIQTVSFNKDGPQVQAMLAYSQSTDPASKHFADQTERFSKKEWITQPYTEAQIKADPAFSTMTVTRKADGKVAAKP
ncbi:acylase [Massilia violaceinigra]|uniref:Acylase n=1 Tax=Massilia violaceinigra TaxID=2045208 RepID=A0ABY4AAD3_9BURK|nr:acylase [Massilia violaceinigra]UOD31557.1 acylase [Massilia violaceinigra]